MFNRHTLSAACLLACLFSNGVITPAMAVPSALSVDQQSKTFKVTGQITDKAKEPLIGVTVTVVGSNVQYVPSVILMVCFHLMYPKVTKPLSSLM